MFFSFFLPYILVSALKNSNNNKLPPVPEIAPPKKTESDEEGGSEQLQNVWKKHELLSRDLNSPARLSLVVRNYLVLIPFIKLLLFFFTPGIFYCHSLEIDVNNCLSTKREPVQVMLLNSMSQMHRFCQNLLRREAPCPCKWSCLRIKSLSAI